ncbi:MAG: hypothetical protein OEY94_06780 [Alphaproteobacteria bacterium]|nr:hypothetical protein [Alphaproteobacteria bacterium]
MKEEDLPYPEYKQELKPLVWLPVERDTYCSQENIDYVIDYFYEHYTDLLEKMVEDENEERRSYLSGDGYYYFEFYLRDFLPDYVPETHLGLVDLVYELSRRYRKTYGLPELEPRFPVFAPTINGPYPVLARVEDDGLLEKQFGGKFKREDIQEIIDDLYKNPAFQFECYALAESMRKNLHLQDGFDIRQMIADKLAADYTHLPVYGNTSKYKYANYVNKICNRLRRVLYKTMSGEKE